MQTPLSVLMKTALDEALSASARGEVPVGAVVVDRDGVVLAKAGNETMMRKDPTGHAEINVLRQAAQRYGSERLVDCDLYVTLEPCAMCAAAISFARIRRLYYGATDVKMGAVESGVRFFDHASCHHKPEVYSGIAEAESSVLLKEFFRSRR
jgi:tRNA(adenine34) deaminase